MFRNLLNLRAGGSSCFEAWLVAAFGVEGEVAEDVSGHRKHFEGQGGRCRSDAPSVLSVTVEGFSQAETARRYGVTRGWVSKLLAQYRTHGEAAFEPRSRRPRSSPSMVSDVLNQHTVGGTTIPIAERSGSARKQVVFLSDGHDVGVISPDKRVSRDLDRVASWARPMQADLPEECQMPDEVRSGNRVISRPRAWK